MARTVRDAKLETRTARLRLAARGKPYYKAIDPGLHLGYRKGQRGGKWVMRRLIIGDDKYEVKTIATADDKADADGIAVLSFAQAQAKARELAATEAREAAEETGEAEPGKPYTVADAMHDYLDWYAAHRKALGATTNAAEAHILPSLGDIEQGKLTTAKIRQWHQGLAATRRRVRAGRGKGLQYREGNRSKASANRILTVLKAALNYAWREGKVASDEAWRRVKPFRGADAAKVRYLSTDECTRLINACDPDFRQLVLAALLTGCRYGELIAMRCDDFNPDAGIVSVRNSKSGRARHVPLTDEGSAFFADVTAGRLGNEAMFMRADRKWWGRSHQARPLRAAAERARVKDVTFHILRHTYGSALAMKGVPMGVIAAALGHADERMTSTHYAHLAPSYVADTIRANLPTFGVRISGKVSRLRPGLHQ